MSFTSTVVPSGAPTSTTDATAPPLTRISVPLCWPFARVRRTKCDTDAIDGSASPRKPSVRIAARSSACRILLVACRSIASRASSGSIPSPSSSTRTCFLPPSSTAMVMRVAPASMAFSTSSLTTDAGRSTTSPAAIWFARSGARRWIFATSDPAAPAEEDQHPADAAAHDHQQHPEHAVDAQTEVRQVDVHAVETRDEGQGHEHGRDDRQDLHDRVQLVRDDRQIGVEQAGDAILEDHRLVGEPHQVIVDVAETIRRLLVDEGELAPGQAADHVALRLDDAAQRRDVALEVEDVLGQADGAAVEDALLQRVEAIVQ